MRNEAARGTTRLPLADSGTPRVPVSREPLDCRAVEASHAMQLSLSYSLLESKADGIAEAASLMGLVVLSEGAWSWALR